MNVTEKIRAMNRTERCRDPGMQIDPVPGFPGDHNRGETLDGLDGNLREVISMIIGDGAPKAVGDLVGTEVVAPG